MTFPLCGCFHYERPACFTCGTGVGASSPTSLSVSSSGGNNNNNNDSNAIIAELHANVNTDIHLCELSRLPVCSVAHR